MKRSLTRWEPFADFPRLIPRDMFGWLELPESLRTEWSPRSEVIEKDDEIIVKAELPGVDRKDVTVDITGAMLRIHGEKRSELKEEDEGRTRSERFYGSFERRYALPDGADLDKIDATMKDGVLEVHVPVPKPAEPQAKKITVKVH